MKQIKVRLTSLSPLLMHSDRGSNPLDPGTQEHKKLTGKRKKTDDDQLAIAKSEWMLGLYFDSDVGPYIPGQNIDAVIHAGAKLHKLGTTVKRGVMVLEDKIPLKYEGPRDPEKLYTRPQFVDLRGVRVGTKRIQRCRPKFDQWSLEFAVVFDETQIEEREIKMVMDDAGRLVGLGDFRPRFGKFEVEFLS